MRSEKFDINFLCCSKVSAGDAMLRSRRLLILSVFILLVGTYTGCGSDGPNSTPPPSSPFAGRWNGTWVDTLYGQTGTLDIAVSGSGNVTGSVVNTTDNESGAVSGRIGSNGYINLYYDYRWASYVANGALSINESGHLVGYVIEYDIYRIAVRQSNTDLIKQ
jgi:hypothetical protein